MGSRIIHAIQQALITRYDRRDIALVQRLYAFHVGIVRMPVLEVAQRGSEVGGYFFILSRELPRECGAVVVKQNHAFLVHLYGLQT